MSLQPPPGSQARAGLYWRMGGDGWWWVMDGQAKSKKITYFKNFWKTIRYFFLVVSRPLRRVLKTFSEKNSKKNKIFILCKKFRTIFFSAIFSIFFSKKVYFSTISRYFFLVVLRPLGRVLKTFSEKKSKKNKIFIVCKKFRTIFFSSIFSIFFIKKSIFLEHYSILFPSCFVSPLKSFKDIFWEKLEKK